jgi:hypothetical protein
MTAQTEGLEEEYLGDGSSPVLTISPSLLG